MSTLSRLRLFQSLTSDRGWWVAVGSGISAGVLIGYGPSNLWQGPAGQTGAGVGVALLTASLAATRPVAKTLLASCLVPVACLMTIIFEQWSSGRWPVGHVDHKWPVVFAPWLFYGCWPALLVSLVIAGLRRRRAEPGAAPNGTLAQAPGASGTRGGPPSVN